MASGENEFATPGKRIGEKIGELSHGGKEERGRVPERTEGAQAINTAAASLLTPALQCLSFLIATMTLMRSVRPFHR